MLLFYSLRPTDMMQRDRQGRYRKVRVTTRWDYLVCFSILGGIFVGMYMDANHMNPFSGPLVYTVEASAEEKKEIEVRLEVVYDAAGIERLIRKTFHEEPNTAVAIVKGEGGLVSERQSDHYKNGVRERSFCAFQINEPSWDREAQRLGYGDYKTNVEHCVKMARHIYDTADQTWYDWSAYTNGSYKKHL